MPLIPFLVTAVDLIWGWSLTTYARPWLLEMLRRPELEASRYYDNVLEPRLWISYAIVLAMQLSWVNLISPRPLPLRQLRRFWWLGCGIILLSSTALRQGLSLNEGASLLGWAVQFGDLILLYWLATVLLTPLPQRRAIPGWW